MLNKLALVLVLMVFASSASARTFSDVTTTYYADPGHTRVVGSTELTCGGKLIRSGRASVFFTKQSDPCFGHRVGRRPAKLRARPRAFDVQACLDRCGRQSTLCFLLPDGTCPFQDQINQCVDLCQAAEP